MKDAEFVKLVSDVYGVPCVIEQTIIFSSCGFYLFFLT